MARVKGAFDSARTTAPILHGDRNRDRDRDRDRDQSVDSPSVGPRLVNQGLNRMRVIRRSFNRKQFNLGRESKSVTSKQEILHGVGSIVGTGAAPSRKGRSERKMSADKRNRLTWRSAQRTVNNEISTAPSLSLSLFVYRILNGLAWVNDSALIRDARSVAKISGKEVGCIGRVVKVGSIGSRVSARHGRGL